MEPLDTIFLTAREIDDPGDRLAYLDQACGNESELRACVDAMLQDADAAEKYFASRKLESAQRPELPGTTIDRYKLLKKIGEGGMGIVYLAEQHEPVVRKVALKIIKAGMDTRQVVARFEAERQALALMDHPNISKVLDGGVTETKRPYFVMDLVEGLPITQFCDEHKLSTGSRLELFLDVCSAIQHAHQKGIIHRDIKPSNILVTMHGDKPVPKVIDFGIAKATQQPLTDKTLFTQFQHFIGTPAYMSPEQASLSGLDIDTRSDIYALGVLLYELLTGRTPFDGAALLQVGLDEMRRTICEREPPRPSTRLQTLRADELTTTARRRGMDPPKLISLVRGDLDWIVMKCLEKDRPRRYETANGLGADIKRFLHNEPIVARPPSLLYRLQKGIRRNRLPFIAVVTVLTALVVGLAISTSLLLRARAAEREKERMLERARLAETDGLEKLRNAYVAQARANRRSGIAGQRLSSLAALSNAAAIRIPAPTAHATAELRNEAIASLALTDVSLHRVIPVGENAEANTSVDPKNNRYALRDARGDIHVYDVSDNQNICILTSATHRIVGLLPFSPDGEWLPVKCDDQSLAIWNVTRREIWMDLPGAAQGAVEFRSDGQRVAVPENKARAVAVYDLPRRQLVGRLSTSFTPRFLAWNPNGQQIAVYSPTTNRVEIVNVENGEVATNIQNPVGIHDGAWHPQGGRFLTTGRITRLIHVWDTVSAMHKFSLEGHQTAVTSLSVDPATGLLASMSWDGTTRFWDILTGRQLLMLSDAGAPPRFSQDGRFLSFVSPERGQLRFYHVLNGGVCRVLRHPDWTVNEEYEANTLFWSVSFSPDDELLLASSTKGVACWDARTGHSLAVLTVGNVHSAVFHPHRREFIAAGDRGLVRWRYDWDASLRRLRLLDSEQMSAGKKCKGACWSASGDVLACVEDDRVRLFFAQTNRVLKSTVSGLNRVALSQDGKWVAALPYSGSPVGSLWEVSSGRLVRHFRPAGSAYLAFSPNSRWLITGAGDGYDFHNVHTGAIERRIPRENTYFQAPLAFSQDGGQIAVAADRTTVSVLDLHSGAALAQLTPPDAAFVSWLCFNHTGTQLAVAGENNLIQVWDLALLRQQLAPLGLDWDSPSAPVARGDYSSSLSTAPLTRPIEFVRTIPPRSPSTGAEMLDLSEHYNMALTQANNYMDNHLAALAPGLHTFGGVRYDVRGRINLQNAETRSFPQKVTGIRVARQCRKLHFLGAFGYECPNGQTVAIYRLHYTDGETVDVPAIAGRDTANWWFRPGESSQGLDVAWTGDSPAATANGYRIRLVHAVWSNPRHDVPIETLDFLSTLGPAEPFLVAITTE